MDLEPVYFDGEVVHVLGREACKWRMASGLPRSSGFLVAHLREELTSASQRHAERVCYGDEHGVKDSPCRKEKQCLTGLKP